MNGMMKRAAAVFLTCCQLLFLPYALFGSALAPEPVPETAPRAIFGNEPVNELYLDVTKTVTAPEGVTLPEGWENKEFTFTIRENGEVKGNFNFVYVVNGAETTGASTTANGKFTLKHGQVVRFKEITPGLQYSVTEDPENGSRYSLIQPSGSNGYSEIITEAKRWEFINDYQPEPPPDSHVFRVQKKVEFPDDFTYDWEDEFHYQLKLDGAVASHVPYSVWDKYGRHLRDSQTDADGMFVLKADETAEFDVTETDYRVEEILTQEQIAQGWQIIGNTVYQGAVQTAGTKTFVNNRVDLTVHKVLSDNSTSSEIFTFQLIDKDNRGIANAAYYLYDRSHNLVEITWGDEREQPIHTRADGSFTLKAGQYAVFVDLENKAPALPEDDPPDREDGRNGRRGDIFVKVLEQYTESFNLEVTAANSSYHKVDGQIVDLEFKNVPIKRSGLYVTKIVENVLPNEIAPRTVDFTFTLYKKDANDEWQPYKANYSIGEGSEQINLSTGNDGRFTIRSTQTAKFNLLPLGEYKVVEELTGQVEYTYNAEGSLTEGEVEEGKILEFTADNKYKPLMMDIVITKTDARSGSVYLPGAEFTVYSDEELQYPIRVSEASQTEENGDTVYHYTVTDLKPGLYYLAETRPPLGYYPLPQKVKLSVEYNEEQTGLVAYIFDGNGQKIPIGDEQDPLGEALFRAYRTQRLDENDQQLIGEDGFPLNDSINMTIPNTSGDVIPASGGNAFPVYAAGAMCCCAAVAGWAAVVGARQRTRRRRFR